MTFRVNEKITIKRCTHYHSSCSGQYDSCRHVRHEYCNSSIAIDHDSITSHDSLITHVKLWRFSTAWYGTVRFGTVHYWGVFHCVPYLVPGTFLVPLRSRFHASSTVTKTWRVNSADHRLAGENRHYCVTELATRDPPLPLYPLDLNQHSQRRIGRNFCLNKRTFLNQPQNSSVVVCWGRTDVPLVDSRGADPARAWWCDAEGKSLMYITLLLNLLYFQSMFSVYIFTSVSVFCFN